jgi:hypothetical protein
MPNSNTVDSPTTLSPFQLQRVDRAFEELFGYKWGTCFTLTKNERMTPTARLLCETVGSTAAARILRSCHPTAEKSNKSSASTTTTKSSTQVSKKTVAHKKQQQYKESIQSSVSGIRSSTIESIAISAFSTASAVAAQAGSAKQQAMATGVDSLLNQMNGPNKISTVAKTAADWDQFKEQTGLGEKLEEQADSSTAYLKKQDFLTRVDHRTFELEKKERDRSRIKRG